MRSEVEESVGDGDTRNYFINRFVSSENVHMYVCLKVSSDTSGPRLASETRVQSQIG